MPLYLNSTNVRTEITLKGETNSDLTLTNWENIHQMVLLGNQR